MVKMNSSDRRAFKKPSHLTPTDPPVDPILEASSNDPDPQSSRTDGSTLQNSNGKKDARDKHEGIEAGDSNAETCFSRHNRCVFAKNILVCVTVSSLAYERGATSLQKKPTESADTLNVGGGETNNERQHEKIKREI